MSQRIDLSFLDRLEILEVLFPLAYVPFYLPTEYFEATLEESAGYPIEVEAGIKVNCGFWGSSPANPTILYFHGNGETAASYDLIAPSYNQRGINLFVAEYRGYGASDGKPTISNLLADIHPIFNGFRQIIEKAGFKKSILLMGRSLGSLPALELALNYSDEIRGLIIESGAANNFRRLWLQLGSAVPETILNEESPFLNKVKIRQIHRPTLIIHGGCDEIVPVTEGEELYQNSGARDKKILIIPEAGHNDLMLIKENLYFDTIKEFVKTYQR